MAKKTYETDSSREYDKAKWWRLHKLGLSIDQLSALSGYTRTAIYLFERGTSSTGRKIKPSVWKRYKNVCAGVEAQRHGEFQW